MVVWTFSKGHRMTGNEIGQSCLCHGNQRVKKKGRAKTQLLLAQRYCRSHSEMGDEKVLLRVHLPVCEFPHLASEPYCNRSFDCKQLTQREPGEIHMQGFLLQLQGKSIGRGPSEGIALCQLLRSARCFLCAFPCFSAMVTRSCIDFYGGPIQETSPYNPQSQMGGSKFTI